MKNICESLRDAWSARGAARLGSLRIPVQTDVGFGDAIVPAPVGLELPTLLTFRAPTLLHKKDHPILSLGSQTISSSAKQRGQSPKEISGGGNPQRCPFSDGFREVLGVVSE